VCEWHHRIKHGHELLEGDPCSRQLATFPNGNDVRQVQEVMSIDHCQVVEMMTVKVGILVGSCNTILGIDLKMYWVHHHIIPRMLLQSNSAVIA